MNKVILMGRLCDDPTVRYTQADEPMCIARYRLAVDRRGRHDDGQQTADFINCVAFGKAGEFIEKYCVKGTKLCISGRIQTGSYTNKDGQKVYTTDVVAEQQEFAESKKASEATPAAESKAPEQKPDANGFMQIPDGFEEELPFT